MSRILQNKKQKFNILVAEDDSFQRLALIDILCLCNYEGKFKNILNNKRNIKSKCC